MSKVLPNNVALKSGQTESNALRFDSGEYLIAASISSGGTMPEAIAPQLRFGDESENALEWLDTDVVLNATDGCRARSAHRRSSSKKWWHLPPCDGAHEFDYSSRGSIRNVPSRRHYGSPKILDCLAGSS